MKDENNTQKTDEVLDEELVEAGYGSAVGWGGDREEAERRRKLRLKEPENYCFDGLLSVKTANEWMAGNAERPEVGGELCGELWREGELALVFGEPGVGKTIFAMHLAETIARGEAFEPFSTGAGGRKVHYLDLRLSPEQFAERYTTGRTPKRKFVFHENLERGGLENPVSVPFEFQGDFARYFKHSVKLAIERTQADVLIIDDLATFAASTSPSAFTKAMRGLRVLAATAGVSILVIADGQPGDRNAGPLTLNDVAEGPRAASVASSVFALGRSRLDPSLRYIKHLKCSSGEIVRDRENVAVFRIARASGPSEIAAVPDEAADGTNLRLIETRDLAAERPADAFIGLQYLGHSSEDEHLVDAFAERLRRQREIEQHARAVSIAALKRLEAAADLFESLKIRRAPKSLPDGERRLV